MKSFEKPLRRGNEAVQLPDFVVQQERPEIYDADLTKKEKQLKKEFNVTRNEARELVYYSTVLDFSFGDFEHKKILDVGSGPGQFKAALKRIGSSAEVVNLDAMDLMGAPDVLGLAQELPFRPNTFDIVVANSSVPILYASHGHPEVIGVALEEMVRVTDTHGLIKIFPAMVLESKDANAPRDRTLNAEVVRQIKRLHAQYPELTFTVVAIKRETSDDKSKSYFMNDGLLVIRK